MWIDTLNLDKALFEFKASKLYYLSNKIFNHRKGLCYMYIKPRVTIKHFVSKKKHLSKMRMLYLQTISPNCVLLATEAAYYWH